MPHQTLDNPGAGHDVLTPPRSSRSRCLEVIDDFQQPIASIEEPANNPTVHLSRSTRTASRNSPSDDRPDPWTCLIDDVGGCAGRSVRNVRCLEQVWLSVCLASEWHLLTNCRPVGILAVVWLKEANAREAISLVIGVQPQAPCDLNEEVCSGHDNRNRTARQRTQLLLCEPATRSLTIAAETYQTAPVHWAGCSTQRQRTYLGSRGARCRREYSFRLAVG